MTTPSEATFETVHIKQFSIWVDKMPPGQLMLLLKTAFWQGQLRETELQQHFRLAMKGIDMMHKPPKPPKKARKRR